MKRRDFLNLGLKSTIVPICFIGGGSVQQKIYGVADRDNIVPLGFEYWTLHKKSEITDDDPQRIGHLIGLGQYGGYVCDLCIDFELTDVSISHIRKKTTKATETEVEIETCWYRTLNHIESIKYRNNCATEECSILQELANAGWLTYLIVDATDPESLSIASALMKKTDHSNGLCLAFVIRPLDGLSQDTISLISQWKAAVVDFPLRASGPIEKEGVITDIFIAIAGIHNSLTAMSSDEYLHNVDSCDVDFLLSDTRYMRMIKFHTQLPCLNEYDIDQCILETRYKLGHDLFNPDRFITHSSYNSQIDSYVFDRHFPDGYLLGISFWEDECLSLFFPEDGRLKSTNYIFLLLGFSDPNSIQLLGYPDRLGPESRKYK